MTPTIPSSNRQTARRQKRCLIGVYNQTSQKPNKDEVQFNETQNSLRETEMARNLSEQNHENEGKDHHVVGICELNNDRSTCMQQKTLEMPRLLRNSAGRRSCSIFRVPQSLIEINGQAYQPRIVSIGPYHRGKPDLKMIEEHKWRFLRSLLSRTKGKGLILEDYLRTVKLLEEKARDCYSETIELDSDEFVEMMVLDGCFIIELFRIVGNSVPIDDPDDPIFSVSWIFTFLLRDLLRLENQIPFFVLQSLFNLSKMPREDKGLVRLALESLNYVAPRDKEVIERDYNLQDLQHLLDLFRSSFIRFTQEEPRKKKKSRKKEDPRKAKVIECVTKLRRAGIKFKPGKAKDSIPDVKFRNGELQMPTITIDDFTISFFLNCVAFEQCYKHVVCKDIITTYATLLDCLINTPEDVGFLCDENIIENHLGSDAEVARFFNKLTKEVPFDSERCYLTKLFEDVDEYYNNSLHVQWASCKNTYFNSPWSFISALAAVILLLLTIAQTVFAILAHVLPPGPTSPGDPK